MACPHSDSCPLFPKLKNSLGAWRRAYCDDEVAWGSCARYELSLTGQSVPLALLPTGKVVGFLDGDSSQRLRHDAGIGSSAAAAPTGDAQREPQAGHFPVATEEDLAAERRSLLRRLFTRRRPTVTSDGAR